MSSDPMVLCQTALNATHLTITTHCGRCPARVPGSWQGRDHEWSERLDAALHMKTLESAWCTVNKHSLQWQGGLTSTRRRVPGSWPGPDHTWSTRGLRYGQVLQLFTCDRGLVGRLTCSWPLENCLSGRTRTEARPYTRAGSMAGSIATDPLVL